MTEQHPAVEGSRIAVVVARFNPDVTNLLLAGCRQALLDAGLSEERIDIHPVPGAWELPLAARELADTGHYDGVVVLGAVVRGETAHFDFISAECARGLQQTQLETGVPVGFGVLTPENGEQAMERADPGRKNKGREAALAVLDMIEFKRGVEA
ncbi:6,7-dimethyl-8-ribityllumazine synthase [Wenzhouxiangella sp. EGI_FJ10305]|uniref:6,7-dimethyl-8-ribityllumazine synthase n=1 Tax=Wenzhouxiangella sp. EGI_FJ10305 TaxID=3243768 RepID=UPI0035D726F6